MRWHGRCAAIFAFLMALVEFASAQGRPSYYVANTQPPDAYLALRTQPSSTQGVRILAMPNGTLLDVVQRRPDGWWYVRVPSSGHEGWALSQSHGRVWIECCAMGPASPQPAVRSEAPTGFRSPSGNIHCQFFKDDDGSILRCDIRTISNQLPAQPADCDLDWGQAFVITGEANSGTRICHGDTVADDQLLILSYGAVWRHDAFTCKSEATGVTCINGNGHGFELSRKFQRLF